MKNLIGKEVATILTKELLKLGFIVHRYNSYTTTSIYLKLDFGVCCGIRIADHPGKKKYHYRFNVIKGYKDSKTTYFGGLVSYFYNYEQLPELLTKVIEEKQQKISKYGLSNYNSYMEKEKQNDLFNRFKKVI